MYHMIMRYKINESIGMIVAFSFSILDEMVFFLSGNVME